ncbi:hypothetical protein FACS189427_01910 [Planctomycetales bacterium]|nr:hypothetical protein FACS189427_01910 [Planctomycetales bacterium]
MLQRNHYERAFEKFLRERKIPYLAVLERYRSSAENGKTIKNFDFVISRPNKVSYLIDVKGRKFSPGGYWRSWSTRDDLIGLKQWESIFGAKFCGLFVFAYQICGRVSPLPPEDLFEYQDKLYGFVGISYRDYLSEVKVLSPRWRTFSLPSVKFRQLARPFLDFVR